MFFCKLVFIRESETEKRKSFSLTPFHLHTLHFPPLFPLIIYKEVHPAEVGEEGLRDLRGTIATLTTHE